MATWYSPANSFVQELVAEAIDRFYPDLVEADAQISSIFAHAGADSDKPPMMKNGFQIKAKIKINSEADRVDGKLDATITFDAAVVRDFEDDEVHGRDQLLALIDHELYHLTVLREKPKKGSSAKPRIKTDDAGRPKFKIRYHDWEVTGFRAVAERHRQHSHERIEAKRFHDDYGNLLFHFGEEFAVQRDLEFAKEILGMTEEAVAEINADHEKVGMPKPFPNGPTKIVACKLDTAAILDEAARRINAGEAGPGITATVDSRGRRIGGPVEVLDSGPVDEITEDLYAEASA